MMIGGEEEIVQRLDPIFAALAPGIGNVPRTPGPRNSVARRNKVTCIVDRAVPVTSLK